MTTDKYIANEITQEMGRFNCINGSSTATRQVVVSLIVFVVTFITYFRAITLPFSNYDDPYYVFDNPHVAQGLSAESIYWSFTTLSGDTSYWHPITWLSHQTDVELFRLRPGLHHLTNVWLHSINTLLVLALAFIISNRMLPAGICAALFGIHPGHYQSVLWIAERKDLLSFLFIMLSVLAHIAYLKSNQKRWSILGFCAFLAAGMSKPIAVVVPCLLVLVDLYHWGYSHITIYRCCRSIAKKLHYFAASVLLAYLTIEAQHSIGALAPGELTPIASRIGNALVVVFEYVAQLLYLTSYNIFYPLDYSQSQVVVFFALTCVILITWLVISKARVTPIYAFAWFWFLLCLIPVIGLIQAGAARKADRYCYLASVGPFMLLAYGLGRLDLHSRKIVNTSIVALVAIQSVHRVQGQIDNWKSPTGLWIDSINAFPINNYDARIVVGAQLLYEQKDTAKAQPLLFQAWNIRQTTRAYIYIIDSYVMQKQFDKALAVCKYAMEVDGVQDVDIARLASEIYKEVKSWDSAIGLLESFVTMNPRSHDARLLLGNLYLELADQGRAELLEEAYRMARACSIISNNSSLEGLLMLARYEKARGRRPYFEQYIIKALELAGEDRHAKEQVLSLRFDN